MDYKIKKSREQEERLGKDFAGRRQIASGALPFAKGDVSIGNLKDLDILFEAKRTCKDSMSIKLAWLVKIGKEAHNVCKYPALEIEIQDERWTLVKDKYLKSLIEDISIAEFNTGDIKHVDNNIYHMLSTDKESILIKKEWLIEIRNGACRIGANPSVKIRIKDECWTMIRTNYLKSLIDNLRRLICLQ